MSLTSRALAMDGGFSLNHPERSWLLWLVPVMVGYLLWRGAVSQRSLRQFSARSVTKSRWTPTNTLNIVAVVGMILALLDVQYGYEWVDVERSGVDIVIAVDVSDSMLVRDGGGQSLSRLSRAKHEIDDLLGRLSGDRVGLVAFSGAAYLQCPLTLDYGAASLFLRGIDTNIISQKGTAVGAALVTAGRALERSPEGSKAILLITDGEDHEASAVRVATKLAEQGVRIFVIGIGQPDGAPIPMPDGSLRRDKSGNLVLSKLDEKMLMEIASVSGGVYVRSVTGDIDLQSIYEDGVQATMNPANQSSVRKKRWFHRFQWFVGASLLALLMSTLLSIKKWEGR